MEDREGDPSPSERIAPDFEQTLRETFVRRAERRERRRQALQDANSRVRDAPIQVKNRLAQEAAKLSLADYRREVDTALDELLNVVVAQEAEIASLRRRLDDLEDHRA